MRLPSERTLAERFSVSRTLVREAIIALEVQGVVEVRVGSGIYVCAAAAAPGPDPFEFTPFPTRRSSDLDRKSVV